MAGQLERSHRNRALAVGFVATALAFAVGAPAYVRSIEGDLESRVPAALDSAGFTSVGVAFSGQDGTIECLAPLRDPLGLLDVAYAVRGVNAVELGRTCRVNAEARPPGSSSEAEPDPGDVGGATGAPAVTGPSYPTVGQAISAESNLASLAGVLDSALVSGEVGYPGSGPDITGSHAGPAGEAAVESLAAQVGATADVELRPAATPAELERELNAYVSADPVVFAPGSNTPDLNGAAIVSRVAGTLAAYANLVVVVEGHTDSDGARVANQLLSQQRAEAVRLALIAGGNDAGRVTAVGYGSTRPILANGVEDKVASRRVEFRITVG